MASLLHVNINGTVVDITPIYKELGISLDRFTQLLDRDFYAPTLASVPLPETVSYTDEDGSTCPFRVGQLCRVADETASTGYRFYLCADIADGKARWEPVPDTYLHREVERLTAEVLNPHRDDAQLPTLCGQPSILFGAGTPQAAVVPDNWVQQLDGGYDWTGRPSALGQQYINTTVQTGGRYIAVRSGQDDLVWLNS